MELRHLRYFIVVAEEGHFTRAAQRLGMKQPPLSQQIMALESELGFELFRRHAKGAELTAGGVVFLKEARLLLKGVAEAAVRAGRAARGAEGTLTVGLTSSAAAHPLIPRALRAYRDNWPGVSLVFREGNAAELTEMLTAGTLDIALLRLPVSNPPGLSFLSLLDEEMLLVLPVGHPALARSRAGGMPTISLKSLKDDPFILVRRHGAPGMYSNLVAACERHGYTPRIAIEVDRMLTNISLVAAGAGVSAVPASMRGFHQDHVVYCRIRDGGPDLRAPLTLVCRDSTLSPAASHFVDLARAAALPGAAI